MFVIRSALEESQVRARTGASISRVSRALCLYASSGLVIESDDGEGGSDPLLLLPPPPNRVALGIRPRVSKNFAARTSTSLKLSRAELGGHLAWAIYN